jgi:hypothetical protein
MLMVNETFASILTFVLVIGFLLGFGTREAISRRRRAVARRRRSFWHENS